MLEVTSAYKNAIKASSRQTKGLIQLDFNNEWDFPFATVTANGTNKDQLVDGRWQASDTYYDSKEDFPTVLKSPSVGWQGTSTSDSGGTLSAPEVIEIEYIETISTGNFWVVGSTDNYPVDFTIEVDTGSGYTTLVTVTGNTDAFYFYKYLSRLDVDKFKLTITKISAASSNAFLYECGGIGTLVFEATTIQSIDLLEELNASAEHPYGIISSNECTISIINEQQYFSPINRYGPYFGLFKPRMRFKPYLGVDRANPEVDLLFTAEDFTLEGFVNTTQDELIDNGAAKLVGIIGQYSSTNSSWTVLINTNITSRDTRFSFQFYFDGARYNIVAAGVVNDGSWHHWAVCRKGNTIKLFIDGIEQVIEIYKNGVLTAAETIDRNTTLGFETNLYVGKWGSLINSAYKNFIGYQDELRITKGLVRYWDDFTPTTEAFDTDTNTSYLLHFDGIDASTTIVDSTDVATDRTINVYGNAALSSTTSKFGTTSLYNDGGSSYITLSTETNTYIEDTKTIFEMVPCGTFWTEDWNNKTNALHFTLTGYDRLVSLKNSLLPQLRLVENADIEALLDEIYTGIGLAAADYNIDMPTSQGFTYGALPSNDTISCLQYIAAASNLSIYTSKRNVIQNKSATSISFQPLVWNDTNMVASADSPFSFQDVYSKIITNVYTPVLSEIKTILELKDLALVSGTTTLERVFFNSSPVLWVSGVKILSTDNVSITDVTYGANDITITLSNTGDPETITIEVRGIVVNFAAQPYEYTDADLSPLVTKTLKVDNKLLQDTTNSAQVSEALLLQVANTTPQLFVMHRGDPAVELMDQFSVNSAVDSIAAIGILLRNKLSWDGTLTGESTFYNRGRYLVYMSMDTAIQDDMGHPTEYTGSIAISSAKSIKGGASALVSGICEVYITGTDFDVGTSDYRFDLWMYPHSSLDHPQALFKMGSFFWHIHTNNLMAYTGSAGLTYGGTEIELDKWQHLVWEKIGTTLTAYKDDIVMFTITDLDDYVAGDWIKLGDGGHILAWIDEIKFEVF